MTYEERLKWLRESHQQLIEKKNHPIEGNGVYERYENPILTADHAPLEWRYDFNRERNPYLMEHPCHPQFRRHQVERKICSGGKGGGRRPQEFLRRGRKPQRRG